MSVIGVSVTMSVSFRLVQQEFSNQFYFYRGIPTANSSEREAIVDEVVSKLKGIMSTDVTFKRAALWSAGGTKAENEMLFQKTLTGTGSGTPLTNLDRERAILIRWRAGKDRLGRPVYLRKWFHTCGNYKTVGFSSGQLQNTLPIADTDRSTIANDANSLRIVGATVDTWEICGPTGRRVEGTAECHKWLEHHQLGDMWR